MHTGQNAKDGPNVWPALVDVIIATLMILLLFMIIQYLAYYLNDALRQMKIKQRQNRLVELIHNMEKNGRLAPGSIISSVDGDRQKLTFRSELLFAQGQAKIDPDNQQALAFLRSLGELLYRAYYVDRLFNQIFIEGHTDNTPCCKTGFKSNWELSTARAVYIAAQLIDYGALRPTIKRGKRFLGAAGYGEFNPVASNDDEAGKAANRRIEITLMYSSERPKN